MCLGAIYWARPSVVYFANSRQDASAIGFDDSMIYDELNVPLDKRVIKTIHLKTEDALKVFEEWARNPDKTVY